jgi:hypothetical protein
VSPDGIHERHDLGGSGMIDSCGRRTRRVTAGHGFALRANRKSVKNLPTTGEYFFRNVWEEKE